MNKMKQIAALTAMLVGVIMYASPAKSAVCFLPDDDGSCGGGDIEISDGSGSDDNKKEEKCEDFPVSATEYEKMKNCFDFTDCKKSKNNEVVYKKGAQKENTTWSNGICCTNGEEYFSKQGQCCPTTGCTCSGGRVWNPSTKQCECPEGKEFVGGVCTCAGNTVPDSDGNCVLPNSCTYEYRQATAKDSDDVTGDLDNSGKCTNCTQCWKNLWKITSLDINTGTPSVKPINKISSTSATCVDENNVTRYQTICQGKPKSKCFTNDGYEFKPNGCVSSGYNNGFEVKGDEWGDCVKNNCNYEYTRIDTSDTYGNATIPSTLYGYLYTCRQILFSGGSETKCKQNMKGVGYYCKGPGGCNQNNDFSGIQMYNKIDKTSKTCKKNSSTIAYEKICPGVARVDCNKNFVSNGCSSEKYNIENLTVEGTDFGTCSCDTSKGYYETSDECREKTKYGCTLVSSCYRSCESLGYYTKREDCEANMPAGNRCLSPGAEEGNSNCFVRQSNSFTITYAPNQKLMYSCSVQGGGSPSTKMLAYLDDSDSDYVKDVNGRSVDLAYKESTFTVTAGTYYLCANSDNPLTISRVTLSTNSGQVMCIGNESGCSRRDHTHGSFCQKVTFQKNRNYYVSITAGQPLEWYGGNRVTGCY